MKSRHFSKLLIAILLGCIFSACKKQVIIGPPTTLLVTSNVFNSDGTATSAMLGVYQNLSGSYNYDLHRITGWSSDELTTTNSNQNTRDIFLNNLNNVDGAITSSNGLSFLWSGNYQRIYFVNAILENLPKATAVSPKVKKQLIGEAEFMRAYFYFDLVNLYGNVPLALTTDYKTTSTLPNAPKSEVYNQIVQDLNNAISNLSDKYVDGTDTTNTVDRIRPNSWAAHALLARVYLYAGNNYLKQAEDQATSVINNSTLFSLPNDLASVFKKNSTEAIWQLANYSGTSETYTPDANFVLTAAPSDNNSTISAQLLNAFEANDQRQVKWTGVYSNGTNAWKYPAKYKDNGVTSTATSEYTMILRLAEQYLIRAEARVLQGNITGALADLNIIRSRAGLSNYLGATDKTSLVNAISHERQVELFAEGDRWFNLKRTGLIDAVMTLVTPMKGGGAWNNNQQLYPIPPSEILADFNLKQNSGY